MANSLRFALVGGLALAVSACTVHQTTAPSPLGTSDFSLALDMTATPDSISQDGSSQSSIVVTAHGPNGAPKSGVSLRLDMQVDGVTQDFGTLNARTVVTGSDGRANAIYTAPPRSPISGAPPTMISIVASPNGTDAQATNTRSVSIRLVPPGVIVSPAQPKADFTWSPTPVSFNVPVTFDASTSCAVEPVNGSCPTAIPGTPGFATIVSYAWDFGDGVVQSVSGPTVSHTYAASTATSFNVTLKVTNDRGQTSLPPTSKIVAVSASPAPSGN